MFALVKTQSVTDPITQETSEVEVIKLFSAHSIWEDKNGIQHTPDYLVSLDSSAKQDLGIYDVSYATRQDDTFYFVTENAPEFDSEQKIVKITFTSTAKPLESSGSGINLVVGLKQQWISQFKTTANNLLAQSDWMLVRKIERNVDVPTEIVAYRAAVIEETARLETVITAVTTVEELIAAVNSAEFPTS
jgi:hypothetical protein